MLRLAFDFIITWRETRTRPNAYQKMNAAKNIQGLNNISAERLVSPIWARFSLLENKKSFNKKVHA